MTLISVFVLEKAKPTEEARVLLKESNGNVELVQRPTFENEMHNESEIISCNGEFRCFYK